MKIIDAQIHLWSKPSVVVPPHRTEPYGIEAALADMDRAGVWGAIIHPPSWDDGSHALAEAAALRYPDRFAILGRIPPDKPERRGEIETWLQKPGMLGLRYSFLHAGQTTWPRDGTMDWVWTAAERLDIPIAILADGYLDVVGQVAQRHPGLRLIVDHFGVRRGNKDAVAFASMPDVVALAKYPNVAVKVTGGPQYVSEGYPFRSLETPYRAVYDAFGPKRMFWGTDITRMPCSWGECVTAMTEHQTWIPKGDLAWIMGRGIAAWLGWKRTDWS